MLLVSRGRRQLELVALGADCVSSFSSSARVVDGDGGLRDDVVLGRRTGAVLLARAPRLQAGTAVRLLESCSEDSWPDATNDVRYTRHARANDTSINLYQRPNCLV